MELRLQDLPLEAKKDIPNSGILKVYEYLAARGITTKKEIQQLGLRILRCADIGKHDDDRAAIVFPHYDFSGNEIDWWSARLVDIAPPTGFGALIPKARGKMYCPPKEPPAGYLVPTLDWGSLPEGATIYIHESCMKAAAGARCLRYSIGLNGVWGWCSKKHGIELISQLRDLPWTRKKLKCVIVFDSNAADNDHVMLAIRRLAETLRLICKVEVRHHLLPKPPEGFGKEDWGFDDFVVHHGVEAATAWLDEEAEVVDLAEIEMLKLQLNEEVCIVRELKKVAVQETGVLMGRSEFCDMNYAHMTAMVPAGDTEKLVNVPRLWLQWDRRRVVEKIAYIPGEGRIVGDALNTWRASGLEPIDGDVSLWLHILEHNVPDATLREWIISWLAYPIQHMGEKLMTYLHLWGPAGTGKQAILRPLMDIYGRNYVTIKREDIVSDFNSHYANRQFINIDELHDAAGHVGQTINNKLKTLVTGEVLMVNRKGDPQYEVRNCAQVVTTGNYPDAIKLDDDDRRACVVQFGSRDVAPITHDWWDEYYSWMRGNGPAAVYGFLLRWDTTKGGFHPKGHAPMTAAKAAVIEAGLGTYEHWVRELLRDPDSVLPEMLKGMSALTIRQLALAYRQTDDTDKSLNSLTRVLAKHLAAAGAVQRELWIGKGKERPWIIRKEAESWTSEKIRQQMMPLVGKNLFTKF